MLEFLLKKGADPNPQLEGTDALTFAVLTGNPDIVSIMLRYGARSDSYPLRDILQASVLYVNPENKMKIAKMLIQNGSYINKKDDTGATPLDVFCQFINSTEKKAMKILRYLLKTGAPISLRTLTDFNDNATEECFLFLWEIFKSQSLPSLEGKERKKALGFILIKAAFQASLELVKELVEDHGVDVNFTNEGGTVICCSEGDTVLMALVRRTDRDTNAVVDYLLSQGADVGITNADGDSIREIALGLFVPIPSAVMELLGEPAEDPMFAESV